MGDLALQPKLFGVPQAELTSDDYYTPRWVFDALGLTFDLDVAAPPGGVDWLPARRYFTQADDGLSQEWTGRVWMNPPFSGTSPWAQRFLDHGNGVAIVPCSRSRWFSQIWDEADAICHPRLRSGDSMFKFVRDGTLTNIYMPVVFMAMGEDCTEALRASGIGRCR